MTKDVLYTAKVEDDLYLNLVAITDNNIGFWKEWQNLRGGDIDKIISEETDPKVRQELEAKRAAIFQGESFKAQFNSHDLQRTQYIAFASYIPITELSFDALKPSDIEMTLGVYALKSNHTTHMGIAPTGASIADKTKKQHPGLSIMLHGFAAKCMQQIHPEKEKMIISSDAILEKSLTEELKEKGIEDKISTENTNNKKSKYTKEQQNILDVYQSKIEELKLKGDADNSQIERYNGYIETYKKSFDKAQSTKETSDEKVLYEEISVIPNSELASLFDKNIESRDLQTKEPHNRKEKQQGTKMPALIKDNLPYLIIGLVFLAFTIAIPLLPGIGALLAVGLAIPCGLVTIGCGVKILHNTYKKFNSPYVVDEGLTSANVQVYDSKLKQPAVAVELPEVATKPKSFVQDDAKNRSSKSVDSSIPKS